MLYHIGKQQEDISVMDKYFIDIRKIRTGKVSADEK